MRKIGFEAIWGLNIVIVLQRFYPLTYGDEVVCKSKVKGGEKKIHKHSWSCQGAAANTSMYIRQFKGCGSAMASGIKLYPSLKWNKSSAKSATGAKRNL